MPLLTRARIRQVEQGAAGMSLMARAGAAGADWAMTLAATTGGPIVVLVGPGNNGGDAWVAAGLLHQRGWSVIPVFAGAANALPPDAAAAYARYRADGAPAPVADWPAVRPSLIIDGLFGVGLTRPVGIPYAALIERANALQRQGVPVLALDCPSGLNADTGDTPGPCIRATHTLSFIAAKPGLYTARGPDHCGVIRVTDLGLGAVAADGAADLRTTGTLIDSPVGFSALLQARRHDSHKGSFGSAGIVGGAPGFTGAALLAGRAALALGAGRVIVHLDDPRVAVDFGRPELMLRADDAAPDASLTALACGPGLGLDVRAANRLASALAFPHTLVLDADALSLIGRDTEGLGAALRQRTAATVLTPHPGEAARLLGTDVPAIQCDRIGAATAMAVRTRATVVLKGAGSVIADPDGRWAINASGTPALASAGTGDVLTGLIAGLLAQGWPASMAAQAAVHLHGRAGEMIAAARGGSVGLFAADLIEPAVRCFNAWIAAATRQ